MNQKPAYLGTSLQRTLLLSALLQLSVGPRLSAQEGRFQIAAHVATDANGRGLLGGQVGVHLARFATFTVSGTKVYNVGPTAQLMNWDATLRAAPWNWNVRPYVLGGVAFVHGSVRGLSDSNDWGVSLGAGIEAGRGLLRGFAEARAVRTGTILSNRAGGTDGWFWAGIRLHLGR